MLPEIPPQPSEHHVWPGWHWVFVQDVPRRSTPAAWLVGWLPSGFRHCFLVRDDVGDGLCEYLNPLSTHFAHGLRSWVGPDPVGTMVAEGMTAVRVGKWIDTRRPWMRGPLTCVAIAKMATGCRWPLVFTPRQFVCRAEREGFEVRRPDVRL